MREGDGGEGDRKRKMIELVCSELLPVGMRIYRDQGDDLSAQVPQHRQGTKVIDLTANVDPNSPLGTNEDETPITESRAPEQRQCQWHSDKDPIPKV